MSGNHASFMNPVSVASYVDETPGKVPGLADLHRMTTLLLAEQASGAARILVVGAGGGLELRAMARSQPDWRFTGVDPSPAMLNLARRTVSPYADRMEFFTGKVDEAPSGPFDGATCLLTLHFLDRKDRLHTLREIRRRLLPGRMLVIAHHTAPDHESERWLERSAVFAAQSGSDPGKTRASAKAMAERLPLLSPSEEEAVLREAGFASPMLFYAALSFRGWVATTGRP